jgi:hypothetical protein
VRRSIRIPGGSTCAASIYISFAFKTPTLRNIELTAPYMHNGVFKTLEEVVDFYDVGGGHWLGIRVQQTLPTDSLHLTQWKKSAFGGVYENAHGYGGTTSGGVGPRVILSREATKGSLSIQGFTALARQRSFRRFARSG